jgi:tetratricopeptide (TPR) repeat protein
MKKSIKFPSFIGRERELTGIDRQVRRQGKTVLINIAGPGGIGKTAILRKVKEQYLPEPDILVTKVIDFSQTIHRSEAWIMGQIISLAPRRFKRYGQVLRKVQFATDPLTRIHYEGELVNAFVADFNEVAAKVRFVILFDTLELIQDSPLFVFVLELVRRLENTVVLLAGRRNSEPDFLVELDRLFKPSQLKTIALAGFSEPEAFQYFEQTIPLHLKGIDPDLQKNIYFLSEGNPIKISLSLDWLDRGIPLMGEVMKMEPAALRRRSKEDIAALRCQFESALMEGIRKFQSPVDEIILYMAHFNKRFNRRMVEFFFLEGRDPREQAAASRKLIAELKELPFVKYTGEDYFVLHDEMSRLVQTYVWDTVEDPDRTLRKKMSERICEHYEKELAGLPDWKDCTEPQRVMRRSYEVEALYYRLYADFRRGFLEFEKLFETLTQDHRSGLAALALRFVEEFKGDPAFSEVMQCFINGYYSGGVLIAREKFEEAGRKLEQGEHELEKLLKTYNWEKAPLDRFLQERSYLVYQQLGYCYRSMGDWTEAEAAYQRSLGLALELAPKVLQLPGALERKRTLMQQIAETLNNLGNLYRLTGQFYEARLLCQAGIVLRKAWGLDPVMSLYVMSMTLWEMGDTAASVTYLSWAEQVCTDDYRLALLKKYRAYILFRTGLAEQALPLLDEAEAIFRNKISRSELAHALVIRRRIYRDNLDLIGNRAPRRSAMKYIEDLGKEALLLSRQTDDKFRIAECHLTQAFHYYHWAQAEPHKAALYRKLALDEWKQGQGLAQGKYLQIYSFYCRLRGDLAFDAAPPDYELAFDYYTEQCKVGSHFKHATYERGIDHLAERLQSLGNTDPARALQFIDRIITSWTGDPKVAKRTELVEELQEVRKTIQESEKLKDLKTRYDQAMLQGEWAKARHYSAEILQIPGFYTDADRADMLLATSRAAHRQEHFAEARRYAKVALQLGRQLKADTLVGNAHLSMTSILWDTTSTAEAAEHLKTATQIFTRLKDEVGLARAGRFYNYILYRTGHYSELIEPLRRVAEVFKKHQMIAEVADAKNLISRVARTKLVDPDYDLAEKSAEEALQMAEVSGDTYRKAECLLSLAALCQREKNYKQVLAYYTEGIRLLPPEAHAIRTVYEGIRGTAYFEMACQATGEERVACWDQAFMAFSRELAQASESKPASLVRSIELLFARLTQLPSAEELTRYTQTVDRQVSELLGSAPQLEPTLEEIRRMLSQAQQIYPFLKADLG